MLRFHDIFEFYLLSGLFLLSKKKSVNLTNCMFYISPRKKFIFSRPCSTKSKAVPNIMMQVDMWPLTLVAKKRELGHEGVMI